MIYKNTMPKCHDCGRFMSLGPGVAWQMIYSGFTKEPDHEIFRCVPCVERLGPFTPQARIKPEFSCGVNQ